jgi:hypothetical protein
MTYRSHRLTLSLLSLVLWLGSGCSDDPAQRGDSANEGGATATAGKSGGAGRTGDVDAGRDAAVGGEDAGDMAAAGGGGKSTGGSESSAGTGGAGRGGAGGHAGKGGSGGAGAGGRQGDAGSGGMSSAGHAGGASGVGGSAGNAGSAAGSGDSVSFADVQSIFDEHCVRCHDATMTHPPGYSALPLTADAAYDAIVSQPAIETCGGTLVVPNDPTNSYLLHKVADATPCEGARMPRPFEVGPAVPLSDAEISTIRSWIVGGAKR